MAKQSADDLRARRAELQRDLYRGTTPVEDMFDNSREVRRIDDELAARGERSW